MTSATWVGCVIGSTIQKSESDVKDKTGVVMLKIFAGPLLLPTKENCENILLIISVVAPFVCGFCKNVVRLEMTRVRQAGRQAGVGPARTWFFFCWLVNQTEFMHF